MKLFYALLLNVFCILSCFAQHSLPFKFSEQKVNLKNVSSKKSPTFSRFATLSSDYFSPVNSGMQLSGFYQYSTSDIQYQSAILRSLSVTGVSNPTNNVSVINEATPVIECTFIATVEALGPTDICPGTPVILSTQTGTGFSFQWLFEDEIILNANSSTYAAYQAGQYSVIVHTRSCKGESVPIPVTVRDVTFFNPLLDTVKQCGGNVSLDAGVGFSDYNWNFGQSSQSIIANSTGNYIVSAISPNGCELKDSCFVSIIAEQINQNNSSICSGSQVELLVAENNGISSQGLSCSWSNGSTANPLNVSPNYNTNYVVDISNGYGVCRDSIYVLVNQPTSSIQQVNACSSYSWNGIDYTQSGVYNFTTTNSTGCDSLVTLYLTIHQPVTSVSYYTACNSYDWYGQTYTSSGLYLHTISNGSGCDEIEQLNLTINLSSESVEYASSCGSYVWNNQYYSTSGTYTYATSNVYGCDSIATLILTINNPTSSVTNVTAYDSYSWNGQTYVISGTYVFMSSNVNGCDSIALLVLNLNTPPDCTITASETSICEGQTVVLSTAEIYSPGRMGVSYRNGMNTSNISSLTYLWSTGETTATINVTPSITTTYTVTISDGNTSCTNSVTITVNHSSYSTEEITSCGSYTWNGEIYNHSGSYIFTTTNAAGCDSVATLNLIINQASYSVEGVTSCGSYSWNGVVYNHSGSYIFTTTNATGCDSTAILNLTINQASSSTDEITSCGNYTWNGEVYNHSGSYIFTTTNAAGCDSVATLNLVIQSLSVIPDGIVSTAGSINTGESVLLNVSGGSLGDGAVWNWYAESCGGTLVGSGNQISVSPLHNTTYFVRAEGTCNTTECVSVNIFVNSCGAVGVSSNATDNTICKGNSVELSVMGTPGVGGTWNWYKNGCGLGCVVATGASIIVHPRVTTTYYVMSVGGQCGTTTCQSITIVVNNIPHSPSVINGPSVVLCNALTTTYSIVPVSGATSYIWTVPNGATIISGQGTSSIEVNFAAVTNNNGGCNNNSICVKANNDCGSSCAACLSVSTSLQGTVSINGPSSVSRNQIVTYTSAILIGANVYTWNVPNGWVILSGLGTNSIQVRTGSQSGSVKVTPSNVCGSGNAAYKYVRVSSSNGSCSGHEEDKSFENNTANLNAEINIWPNPVSDYLNIDAGRLQPIKIEMLDRQGKLVLTTNLTTRIGVNELASGIYFLRVYTNGTVYTKRVQIIR